MLSVNQLNIMLNKKRKVCWTPEEISQGFTMSYFSRPGYIYLTKELKYPLPAIRTLKKHAENFVIAPGILYDSFKMLKSLGKTLTPAERLVVLAYDEMKCKSCVEYHKGLDCIFGPHSQMQVVMVRALVNKFKQPIFVDFDRNVTKELLHDLTIKLHEAGFKVVAVVSDNGGGNVGLSDTPVKSTFNHQIKDHVSDTPHCLKLLRNWLLDGGFVLSDGTILNANKIRELLSMTNSELSPSFKLSQLHVMIVCYTIFRINN